MVSGLLIKSLVHFEFIFVSGGPRLFLIPSHLLCARLLNTRGAKQAHRCLLGGSNQLWRTDKDRRAGKTFVPKG